MLSEMQVEMYKEINGSEEPADEKTKKDIERKWKKRNVVQISREMLARSVRRDSAKSQAKCSGSQ